MLAFPSYNGAAQLSAYGFLMTGTSGALASEPDATDTATKRRTDISAQRAAAMPPVQGPEENATARRLLPLWETRASTS